MNVNPVATSDRIEVLDVYRGFAILGIFVVNITVMNSTFINQDLFAEQWTSWIDQSIVKVRQLFFYTKFFPIFSLLFGLGISMQAIKRKTLGQSSLAFISKRMLILFIIGAIHITFIWSGDVVHIYAILGLLTVFLIKVPNRILLILSILILVFPFFEDILFEIFNWLDFSPDSAMSSLNGDKVAEIIKNGSYLDNLKLRLLEYVANLPMLLGFLAPTAASMFLLGLYLGKKSVFNDLKSFLKSIQRPMLIVALVTNIYRVVFLYVLIESSMFEDAATRDVLIYFIVLCDVFMGIFYLWLLGWLYFHTKANTLLRPLSYVGRMALTNYILQSIVGLFLFTSIGFSLYETFSPTETFLIAIGVFIIQVNLSRFWLKYFKYGPLEWIWRCLSYSKLFKIRN